MGQRQLPKDAEWGSAVDAGGLEDVRRLALQAGEHDQHHERRPLPDEDGDYRRERMVGDEGDRAETEEVQHLVEDPEERREHLLLPEQGRDNGHQQERRDQQRPDETLPKETAIEQDREQRSEEQR